MKEIILPDMGENITEATVSFWHHQTGEEVKAESELVEFYTDKANFSVKCPVDGILKQILVKEGEKATVGKVIGIIEEK